MPRHYWKIGSIRLDPIPSLPQSILWIWNKTSLRLDPGWLEGVKEISGLIPDLKIRTAHLSADRSKGQHVDGLPGPNLIWIHQGSGFHVEDERVIAQPGDIILFERSMLHWVDAAGDYLRTVLTTVHPVQESRYPQFLKNGIFYDQFAPMKV